MIRYFRSSVGLFLELVVGTKLRMIRYFRSSVGLFLELVVQADVCNGGSSRPLRRIRIQVQGLRTKDFVNGGGGVEGYGFGEKEKAPNFKH